jgi:SAM-dependent methyltransferase
MPPPLWGHPQVGPLEPCGPVRLSSMGKDRDGVSREEFARTRRRTVNTALSTYDNHPHDGYKPEAFRHYIRERALLGALQKLDFATVLDVGCSEGYFAKIVGERFGVEVWGVDLSTVALAKARDRYGLDVAAADVTRLPFADGSFDLVFSTEVIEYVLDPEEMIAEMRRVARGTALVMTPVSQAGEEHEPDYEVKVEGHVNDFDEAAVRRLFGPDARLGSFRCNATLALIVGAARRMPAGVRDSFYRLDHFVSQHAGAPGRRLKPLRNRDWLITVPAVGVGDGQPRWRCPACAGELQEQGQTLRCSGCGERYPFNAGVPDFLEPVRVR